jgi:hypothetical protein
MKPVELPEIVYSVDDVRFTRIIRKTGSYHQGRGRGSERGVGE